MSHFTKYIGFFLLFFLTFSLIGFTSINFLINKRGNFDAKESYSTYIMGHSHAEFAYNDTLITNTKNFANSAEPYFYTYSKLKKLASQNQELKYVLLEFSNNSVSKAMDDWIWEQRYLDHRFTFYAPFLNLDQIAILISNNPIISLENFFKSLANNLWKIIRDDIDYIKYFGQYSALTREMPEEPKVDYILEDQSEISEKNLKYLDKIISLCKTHNIKLILIRTPQHESCSELANEKTFQNIYETEYSSIPFLDLQNFPLEIKDFADVEHLNKNGAMKISTWLNGKIQNGAIYALKPGITSYFP